MLSQSSFEAERIPFGDEIAYLQQLEQQVDDLSVEEDRSLRAKTTDSCGLRCHFCHNEGTPVALTTGPQAQRVSIFADYNGANFVPGAMSPDAQFSSALSVMTESLGVDELHWTGGEPTHNRDLPALTRIANDEFGLVVKMTSNGEKGAAGLEELAEAGLSSVIFSIFGTTANELSEVQINPSPEWAQGKIDRLGQAILAASNVGLSVGGNIVVSGPQHIERVRRLIGETPEQVTLRLQADLASQQMGWASIYKILADNGAIPKKVQITAGTSDAKIMYETPEGRKIAFKRFLNIRVPDMCNDCRFNDDVNCKEGYYGVRLYINAQNEYLVGVCLQRMDLTVDLREFSEGDIIKSIIELRRSEREKLLADPQRTVELLKPNIGA